MEGLLQKRGSAVTRELWFLLISVSVFVAVAYVSRDRIPIKANASRVASNFLYSGDTGKQAALPELPEVKAADERAQWGRNPFLTPEEEAAGGRPETSGLEIRAIIVGQHKSVASLGGRTVTVGEKIGEEKVLEIRHDVVVLERDGRRRVLKAPPVRAKPPSRGPLPELIVAEIEQKKEPERVYTFTLRDAEIHEVLLAISMQTSFSIVMDPDVQGRVTLDLKKVTLTDAMDTLSDLLGLTYKVKQNSIRISKPAVETRIFSLQYVHRKRSGTSPAAAQIGAAETATPGVATEGEAGGLTTVTAASDTDLWTDVEAGVKNLLSAEGKVVVDKKSGNIVVTDLPEFLDRVARFLESMGGSVQR